LGCGPAGGDLGKLGRGPQLLNLSDSLIISTYWAEYSRFPAPSCQAGTS